MGVEILEIGVRLKKVVIFSIRICNRTVWNHPILVGMLCYLAILYRSFPFLFSLLVSASPVLVCTALLLGTLLSFGQPNIPEIEREEKTTHDIVPLKTGQSGDATHVKSEDSYYVERFTVKERDAVEQSFEKSNLEVNKISEVHRDQSLSNDSPILDERSRELQFESGVFEEAARELYEQKNEKRLGDGELMDNQYSPILKVDDESIEFDNGRSVDSFDSRRVHLDSPPGSPWKQEEEEEEEETQDEEEEEEEEVEEVEGGGGGDEEEEEDEASDSGSDRAESSSPDASMADIIPMLDELHPLLDEDTPQPICLSRDGSDAASESSGKSSESDNESDSENQEELEVADDENEDGEDEEARDNEDQTKSAITWTEEDQKNLMDLGTSELERNQRLESLIARRRARKNMRVMAEKNLIDFDSADPPFNIPPISTARNNPFDLPNDIYDLGLPPIPGSAPSILLTRQNPFDLPYDSSEEKPDLMGDSFQQEFMSFPPKEPFFRRRESFNVGPSIFGLNKQDKQDSRFRPYFVPERMTSEGTSYSPFQRQSSELSDSKVSSVPETESLGSVEDLEEKNHIEEDAEGNNNDEEEQEIKNLIDEHICEEPELISKIELASEDVGHGSQSSEEVESLEFGTADKRDFELDETDIKLGSVENHHEVGPTFFPEGIDDNAVELTQSEIHLKSQSSEQRYSSQSSSSSLSEVSERIFVDKEGEERSDLEETRARVEEIGISRQPSLDGLDLSITSTSMDETSRREPVYDTSPPSIRKNTSSSSFSSDVHGDTETGLPAVLVKRTGSFTEREALQNSQDTENSILANDEVLAPLHKKELVPRELVYRNELDVGEISKNDKVFSNAGAPPLPELVVDQAYIDSKSFSDEDIGYTGVSEDQSIHQLEEEHHSLSDKEVQLVQPCIPLQSVEDLSDKEVSVLTEQDGSHSSNAVENMVTESHREVDEKVISVGYQFASVEESISQDHGVKDPLPVNLVESVVEESTENLVSEIHDFESEVTPIINSPRTPESILNLHEWNETPIDLDEAENHNRIKVLEDYKFSPKATDIHDDVQYTVEYTDDIKDIDEALLSELDTVGDFSMSHNKFERQINSSGEYLSRIHNTGSSTTEFYKDSSVVGSEREFVLHSENLNASAVKEEVDEYKDERESDSEFQKSGTNSIDHVDASRAEVTEEAQSAVDPKSVQLPDSDIGPSDSTVEQSPDAHATVSGVHVIEARSLQDIEHVFEQTKLKSTQIGVTEMPQEVVVKTGTDSGIPVLEAQLILDPESALGQVCEKETEKSRALKRPNADLPTEESGGSDSGTVLKVSNSTHNEMPLPNVEARSTEVVDLDHRHLPEGNSDSVDSDVHTGESGDIDLAMKQVEKHRNSSSEDAAVEAGSSEAGSAKDVESSV